jgi:hypothetical protein
MTEGSLVHEWQNAEGATEARLLLAAGEDAEPIRVERHGDDVFFLTPDSRLIGAFFKFDRKPVAA